MLFNSVDFALFLPIVFGLYWSLRGRTRPQNALLLLASYVFYGWWDWRFLSLIVFSSAVDYGVGLRLAACEIESARRRWLGVSLTANLGLLAAFKYFGFFLENLQHALSALGIERDLRLDIVLPVGISFYTFQTLSYTIDIYRRRIEPTRDVVAFFTFVGFFPQLVAGPIERARDLLPQFERARTFSYERGVDGLRQILCGLFKKMVVADGCAAYVDAAFAAPADASGSTLLLAAALFAFQIYGDFSGYSDIAIGCARLFGFGLTRNFATPYFARDIAEFWRRWHISLTSWFTDYVYIPLGGNRRGVAVRVRNTVLVFLVSGLWHGANWTFVAWGALHALFFLPLLLRGRTRQHTGEVAAGRWLPNLPEVLKISGTFALTTLAWVLFRAESLQVAGVYLAGIWDRSLFTAPALFPTRALAGVVVLVVAEWLQRGQPHALTLGHAPRFKPLRWTLYYLLACAVILFGGAEQEFIYFRF